MKKQYINFLKNLPEDERKNLKEIIGDLIAELADLMNIKNEENMEVEARARKRAIEILKKELLVYLEDKLDAPKVVDETEQYL